MSALIFKSINKLFLLHSLQKMRKSQKIICLQIYSSVWWCNTWSMRRPPQNDCDLDDGFRLKIENPEPRVER